MNTVAAVCTIFLIVVFESAKCVRISSRDMLEVIRTFNVNGTTKIQDLPATKQCLAMMSGQYHPEVQYFYATCETSTNWLNHLIDVVQKIDLNSCSGFQCWESQLTDITRLEILNIFNVHRQKIARGTCGPVCRANMRRLVYEMKWSIYYELDAWREFHRSNGDGGCVTQGYKPALSFYKPPTKWAYRRPHVHVYKTSWQVETGSQLELRITLEKLIEENRLLDFNNMQFAKGLADEVGCAYVLRYNVSKFTTAREGTVVNKNIAHLVCVFGYTHQVPAHRVLELHSEDNSFTNDENCKKMNGSSEMASDSLYPSLCREMLPLDRVKQTTLLCQPDSSYHSERHSGLCNNFDNSSKNPETWNEKPYGFILKFQSKEENISYPNKSTMQKSSHDLISVECNIPDLPELPKPPEESTDKLDFDCTLRQEVQLMDLPTSCEGWSCDDSQLTDEVRQYILNSLNGARHLVAQGMCSDKCRTPCDCSKKTQYCNMVQLRWHWYLEMKAMDKVRNCSTTYSCNKVSYGDSPFQEIHFFEEVSLVFDLPTEGQIELPKKFADLFWMNGLNDWSKDGTFRRGNAAWIGCAIVIRPGQQTEGTREEYKLKGGSAAHMVCIYVSLNEDFISFQNSSKKHCCPSCSTQAAASTFCRLKTVKNISSFPDLCSSVLLDISMSCAINLCPLPRKKSAAWAFFIAGKTVLEHRNGTHEFLNRIVPSNDNVAQKHVYSRKICKLVIFSYLLALSVLCLVLSLLYKYYTEKKMYTKV